MSCTFDFTGKKVLVTGASQGLGREIAKSLSKFGAVVYAFARNREKLDSLSKEHKHIIPLVGDITWPKEQIEALLAEHQPFDFLINNAAVAYLGSALEAKIEQLDEMFQVNVRGTILISEVVVKQMIDSGIKGSIVNVSSQSGLRPLDHRVGYCSSKAALDMATRVQAREWGQLGIRVNSVNPTVILLDKGLGFWSDPDKAKWMLDQLPLKKFAEPRDVINAICFLLSDGSSLTTGMAFPIDGGYSQQ